MTYQSAPTATGLVAFRSRADELLVGVLGLHLLVCLATGVMNGTWGIALSIGLPAFLIPLALTRMARGEAITRVAVGCAFMIFSALLIQQTQGTIEAHFGIFVLLAFLVLYCDWLPLLAAAALIAVHHVGFAWLQYSGAGVYIFPEIGGIWRVVVHAVYVVVETVLLCYMAAKLRGMVEDGMTVAEFASEVSQGRLDYQFDGKQLQLRPLLGTVAQMQGDLRDTLRDVHRAADDLNALAARLTSSSVEMSRQSANQGESISTMAAATEEMTVSISHVAQSAAEARKLADDSRNAANDGSKVVTTTAKEMVEIANVIEQVSHLVESLGKKSEEASQVVDIIKGIADQTNLLALNAAIEAARAGEVGRGFAVVADEVRKLAEHTMTATNQIAQMMGEMRGAKESVLASIMDAVKRVQAGVLLADEAGKRIEAITHQSTQVENIVTTISSALDQQNAATQDIAQHVENISRMAEASTAAIESVASEAHNLEGEANQLIGALSRFKL